MDSRLWLRDLAALLALPALWVDHDPAEIADGLLSVLLGMLRADSGYARFDDSPDQHPLEAWRPSGSEPPEELRTALNTQRTGASGMTTTERPASGLGVIRVARLQLTLPWGDGTVLVSTGRADFPTPIETHQLRVAVSQAAIAIHTARRLAREHAARSKAERALLRQTELLRALSDDVRPSLASAAQLIHDAARVIEEADTRSARDPLAVDLPAGDPDPIRGAAPAEPRLPLTRREAEVLGLLAQGLSNKEIAGVMWLSDRTVERHITSLYRKIGVARRSEATAFALQHGIG
ncbi:LuxR C-terminal-related transcriptional regulator [Agromyces aurantiacus]|uniref:LuxR C-terminal-related transcriptional regulator n=1 Tax=Agromyces aurantiacus TaxID=165814 RepID=A0ABV9R618_9MICO|nr:helix-turn-helix transcriptional regulator [Agromyces aurantiacus]MBM7503684.1 DNA-binding NarL/FixJ family response regulator [Agromyces aurantiacus]